MLGGINHPGGLIILSWVCKSVFILPIKSHSLSTGGRADVGGLRDSFTEKSLQKPLFLFLIIKVTHIHCGKVLKNRYVRKRI